MTRPYPTPATTSSMKPACPPINGHRHSRNSL
jgi:hypothetical protein